MKPLNILLTILVFLICQIAIAQTTCEVLLPNQVIKSSCNSGKTQALTYKSNCSLSYTKLTVYNRWGNILFVEENANEGFKGVTNVGSKKEKGNKLTEGTYYYSFEYSIDNKSETQTITGYVVYLYN